MSGILSEIQDLHHAACAKAKPNPEKLAAKLFHWELRSDWEVFAGAVDQYAVVLGGRGLEAYRVLAEVDSRLREFLGTEYHKLNRHKEAIERIWVEFVDQPRFEVYKLLKSHAVRA